VPANHVASVYLPIEPNVGMRGPVSVAVQYPPATPLDVEHAVYYIPGGTPAARRKA
jgi:hypothetical protein